MGKIKFELTLKSIEEITKETKDGHSVKAKLSFENDIDEKLTMTGDPGITAGLKVGSKFTWVLDNPQQTIEESTKSTESAKPKDKVDSIEKANKVAEKVVAEKKEKETTPKPGMPRIGDKKRELAAAKNNEAIQSEGKKSKGTMNYLV